MVTNSLVFTFLPLKSLSVFFSLAPHCWCCRGLYRLQHMPGLLQEPLTCHLPASYLFLPPVFCSLTCLWVGVTFLKCRFSSWNLPYFQITVRVKSGHLEEAPQPTTPHLPGPPCPCTSKYQSHKPPVFPQTCPAASCSMYHSLCLVCPFPFVCPSCPYHSRHSVASSRKSSVLWHLLITPLSQPSSLHGGSHLCPPPDSLCPQNSHRVWHAVGALKDE